MAAGRKNNNNIMVFDKHPPENDDENSSIASRGVYGCFICHLYSIDRSLESPVAEHDIITCLAGVVGSFVVTFDGTWVYCCTEIKRHLD